MALTCNETTWYISEVNRNNRRRKSGDHWHVCLITLITYTVCNTTGHMQMSMRNCVTPELKLILTLTLTLTDTEGAVLTLMLGYRSLYITWQQHHNCRIIREFSLRILICILPNTTTTTTTSTTTINNNNSNNNSQDKCL